MQGDRLVKGRRRTALRLWAMLMLLLLPPLGGGAGDGVDGGRFVDGADVEGEREGSLVWENRWVG